jgi:hypothetical protein
MTTSSAGPLHFQLSQVSVSKAFWLFLFSSGRHGFRLSHSIFSRFLTSVVSVDSTEINLRRFSGSFPVPPGNEVADWTPPG